LSKDPAAGPLVWIHGASVGEVRAAAALIERLRALDLRILLTSGTVTSARSPPGVFRPMSSINMCLTTPRAMSRASRSLRPGSHCSSVRFVANLILASAARRLPLVLINGRTSHARSRRWRRISGTISGIAGRFEICLAQSQVDAERLRRLAAAT